MKDQPQWLEVLLALDQLGNTFLGGDSRETISSTIGKDIVMNRGGIMVAVGAVLDWLDEDHCLDAIDWENGETFTDCFKQYHHHREDGKH